MQYISGNIMFKDINFKNLKRDIELLELELKKVSKNDIETHFSKILFLSNFFYFGGLFLLFLPPITIIPWLFLSIGIFSKWTMIGHHVCHGGYDFLNNKYNRKKFGLNSLLRRFLDWLE